MEKLFFGYASSPELTRSAIREAASACGDLPTVQGSVSWEDLLVDGQLIIEEIEASIASATLALFELSSLNHNVLFEAGIAIGSGKPALVLLDVQDKVAAQHWETLSLLKSTGYTGYRNSEDLVAKIAGVVAAGETRPLLDSLLQGLQTPVDETKVLYVPSVKQDNASSALSRQLGKHPKFEIKQVDLEDFGTAPLAWYVQQIYTSGICVIHLAPERAYLSDLMNPRASLLAGIARGLGRKLVVVSEESERAALDYRDVSIRYANPRQLERRIQEWLEALPTESSSGVSRTRKNLNVELASMRFGNHVAEGDSGGLGRYFIETSDFKSVMEADSIVFTGRKGTGKTANMLQASERLRGDARNLVCVVKPASYEIEALVELLHQVPTGHLTDFVLEAFWKYILYTEIAIDAIREGEAKPAGIASGSDLATLKTILDNHGISSESTMASRLEALLSSLSGVLKEDLSGAGIEKSRAKVSAALYGGALHDIRAGLVGALGNKDRVALLVDNLDKAWERGADLDLISRLVLGLLSVLGRVEDEFRKSAKDRSVPRITLTVFLRSDIYSYVRDRAREPDKIATTEIEWRNPELLARVLEERFLDQRKPGTAASDLWDHYFNFHGDGNPRDYLLSRVQARPRDLVFFANAAVNVASDLKHGQISKSDVRAAEREYSQFAYEALLVEGMASNLDLERAIIALAGESSILEDKHLTQLLSDELGADALEAIKTLRRLGLLGKEIEVDRFDFGGTEGEIARADVMAVKMRKSAGRAARYQIHPAYRSYLEISDAES
jgi:hypothetical protein